MSRMRGSCARRAVGTSPPTMFPSSWISPSQETPARLAAAHIAMDQRDLAGEALNRRRRRGAEIAQPQAIGRRNAIGMGSHMAIEDMDVAAGQALAQVVVAAPVAQPELHHRAGTAEGLGRGPIQADAQGHQPGDRAVEPAGWGRIHCRLAAASLSSHWRSNSLVVSTRCASTRMTSTAMVGKSLTMRKNSSLVIFNVVVGEVAVMVAVRGTSSRMPISPTI